MSVYNAMKLVAIAYGEENLNFFSTGFIFFSRTGLLVPRDVGDFLVYNNRRNTSRDMCRRVSQIHLKWLISCTEKAWPILLIFELELTFTMIFQKKKIFGNWFCFTQVIRQTDEMFVWKLWEVKLVFCHI